MVEWGITSTILILAVLMLRSVLRGKVSHRVQYALWLVVLVRLLVPVTFFDSPFGIMNFMPEKVWIKDNPERETVTKADNLISGQAGNMSVNENIQNNYNTAWKQNINGDTVIDNSDYEDSSTATDNLFYAGDNPVSGRYDTGKSEYMQGSSVGQDSNRIPEQKEESGQWNNNLYRKLMIIWFVGALVVFCGVCIVNLRFFLRLKRSRKKISQNVYPEIDVYHTGAVVSPCLFGLVRPSIYLDSDMLKEKQEFYHVLTHEYIHYRHLDYIWASLRMVCICLHWYNPVVWYGAYVSVRDCELACDEGTIQRIGEKQRVEYGETLLRMIAIGRRFSNVCCTATTMVDSRESIRERIKSIAEKTMNHKWAVLVMVFIMLIVSAVVFTGKDSDGGQEYNLTISRKELKELLLETGGYEKDILYDVYEADYDRDGADEAFLFVLKDENITRKNRDEYETCLADIWYYEDSEGLTLYKRDENIAAPLQHIYVMELSDKNLLVYEQLSEVYMSRALGVRNGEVLDYFHDPKLTYYVDGQAYGYEDNDIRIYVSRMNAEYDVSDNIYYGDTTMTEYWYYDAYADIMKLYPAYAKTEEEVRSYENGAEILQSIENKYPSSGVYYTYAVRNNLLHITVQQRLLKTLSNSEYYYDEFYYYTYELDGNVIGELEESGKGFYDDLNEESVREVEKYNETDRMMRHDLLEEYSNYYSSSLIRNPVLYTRYEEFTENSATVWIYEECGAGDVQVWTVDLEYEREGNSYRLTNEWQEKWHGDITGLEEFKKAYCQYGGEEVPWDDMLELPDFFSAGIEDKIIKQGIEEYYEPDTAAISFFHLSGGKVADLKPGENQTASLTYVFGDNSSVELYMYKTYQGIWLPLEGENIYSYSCQVNQWFASLTENDYLNAKTWEETYEWYDERIILLEELPGIGVKIYGNPGMGRGVIIEYNGRRHLFDKCFLTTRVSFPQFKVYDYDKDGESEIGMISYTGSGTGFSVEDFCIIDSVDEKYDTLYEQSNEECMNDISFHLGWSWNDFGMTVEVRNEENAIAVFADRRNSMLEGSEIRFKEIYVGDIVSYSFGENGEIICDAQLLISCEDMVTPCYFSELRTEGNVVADSVRVNITYDGNGVFHRGQYRYSADGEELSDLENTKGIEIRKTSHYYIEKESYLDWSLVR